MKCPNCGDKLVDIVYGLPAPELMEKAKNKEVCLGGCDIIGGVEQARYHCFKCEKSFYKDLSEDDGTIKFSLEKNKI